MYKGKVKWFNSQKGYGFIEHKDKDYFAHYSEIKQEGFKELQEGQLVSFDIKPTSKGLSAIEITVQGA